MPADQSTFANGLRAPEKSNDFKVVEVDNVSKTYCRNLRKSLWYGLQDIYREMTFRGAYSGDLRSDEFEAVKNSTFDVSRGECVALLGPNGAGKSTMLKMINGILRPNQGSITIRGRISALIELGTGFNPILSGRENVFVNASVLGFSKAETEERFDDILEFSEIGEFIDAPVRTYSSGMKVRLGFAVASHLSPDLMLIDEVLAVGDLAFRMKCFDHLQKRVASGVSVILVSHMVAMMPRFCTRAIVFDKGAIAFDGDIMEGIAEYQNLLGIEQSKLKSVVEDDFATLENDPSRADDDSSESIDVESGAGAQIETVSTLDENFQPKETFETNEPLVVEVVLTSDREYKDCKLVLNLVSTSVGLVSSLGSKRKKFYFDLPAGQSTRVRLKLNELPLIDGGYSFSATLHGPGKANPLDRKHALSTFRVLNADENRRALKGVLILDHEWETVD